MAGTSNFVQLSDIVKNFGDIVALNEINISLEKGEFFSLLGPSGCGKTTTLRIISGFESPTTGTVKIAGENVANQNPENRNTNLIFQNLSLFPHMSVRKNIEYGLKKSGVKEKERDERVDKYLKLVDLADFGSREPTEISGGQQQRVAIARALVNEPDILLLDEPLSSLDRKLRQRMQVELQDIHERVNSTFFYVTHDQDVAMSMSDRMAIMRNGEIEQIGTPEKIYQNPSTKFVADFIGDTNLLSGEITNGEKRKIRLENGETLPLKSKREELRTGSVIVSVRPEDINLMEKDSGIINGSIINRHFHGDQTNYIIKTEDGTFPDFEVSTRNNSSASIRDKVSVNFSADNISIFEN